MEQRRLLLAIALSLLVLVVYQELVLKRFARPRAVPQEAETTATTGPPAAAPPGERREPAAPASDLAAPPTELPAFTVETDVYRAAITPLGARLSSLELKRYRRTVDPASPPLDLVEPGEVLPLTLGLGPSRSDARVVYRPDRPELVLHGAEQGEVGFTGETDDGVKVEKRFRFTGEGYLFDVSATVSGAAAPKPLALVLTPVPSDSIPGSRGGNREMSIAFAGGRVKQESIVDLQKQETRLEDPVWAGFAAQYFMTAIIPGRAAGTAVMTAVGGIPVVRLDDSGSDGRTQVTIFAGPKDQQILDRGGHDLDRALDFGRFWFIAVPLLSALRLLRALTGNYGVAIIVLTALVKAATTPLTQTTFRNMREMQKIQPQMAKLRERYKNDQVALQKEMMELYKRHRVNPLSGCLPMLLQLPIFVGLYNALSLAIELRHAPFLLWIRDLSAPEKLMIAGLPWGVPVLTLLMGASMFLQQWMSPQQGDPTQQRMMLFMPLVFTFMFMNFPAGLVLYWLVNNVLTIGQQYFIMRSRK